MPFLWLVIFAINGLYAKDNLLGGTREYSMVFRSAGEGFLLIVIAGFLEPNLVIARGWLLMAWPFTFFFVAVSRFWLRRLVYSLRRLGFFLTPAVIVGANQEGRWLAEQLLEPELEPVAELEPPALARELIGSYLDSAQLLGQRTAEMHWKLASVTEPASFAPAPFSLLYQRSIYQTVRSQAGRVLDLLSRRLQGLHQPIASNASPEGQAKNRRVELRVVEKK